MSPDAWVALLPLLVPGGATVLLLLVIAVRRSHALVCGICLAALAASLALLLPSARRAPLRVLSFLAVDGYSLFFTGLLTAGSLGVALFSYDYLRRRGEQREELYLLLLTSTLGAGVIATSIHYAAFFLGLEILTVSLYGLAAYFREEPPGVEAGVKYLVLAGVSSAFLLFGIALIYAATGGLEFEPPVAPPGCPGCGLLALTGVGLFVVGIGFKLAVVPFHMWTPDVYQGASLPVAALIATVSKGAVFALLLRYAWSIDLPRYPVLLPALALISAASMFTGNLLALRQDDLKRLLACSSIAHMGYLLVPLAAWSPLAGQAVAFYLVFYFVSVLGAFGVLAVLSTGQGEVGRLEDVRGLVWRRPALALVLAAMLFSLAGLPLTAGFLAKIYVLAAGVGERQWALAVILAVNSAIGLFYYLRVILSLFAERPVPAAAGRAAGAASAAGGPAGRPAVEAAGPVPVGGGIVLAVLILALVWLGLYPAPLIRLIQAAVGNLAGR